jgi:hypothetical protein
MKFFYDFTREAVASLLPEMPFTDLNMRIKNIFISSPATI